MFAGVARQNFKAPIRLARHLANQHVGYLCKRRCFLGKARDEILDEVRRALNFDGDPCRRITDIAAEVSIRREPMDVRPESDSLHDPGDLDFLADLHGDSGGGRSRARDFALAIQPSEPFGHSLARLARHSNDVHISVDAPRILFGGGDIEGHIGQ